MVTNDHKVIRRRILMVDDNRGLLDALAEALEDQGFEPEPVGDVRSARALYRRKRPDLVLLDCDIRGEDGLELLGEFRQEPPASPVIVMTARDDSAIRVRARRLGAQSMVNKPFRLGHLIAEIQRILLVHGAMGPSAMSEPLRLLAYHLPKLLGCNDPAEMLRALRDEQNKPPEDK